MTERARPSVPHDSSSSSSSSSGGIVRRSYVSMSSAELYVSGISLDEGALSDYDDELAGNRRYE